MPKDAKKNVDRYKIRGGDLNEFEYQQNQGQVRESMEARKGAAKGAGTKKSAKATRGATAKKLAAAKKAKK